MADMITNSTANVSTGKGVAGGYLFRCKLTESEAKAMIPLLSDFTKTVFAVFDGESHTADNLGYVADSGLVFSESTDTSGFNDLNGDEIHTSRANRSETVKVTLVEQKKASLDVMYGSDNVTDSAGLITVHHNNSERESAFYVADLLLKEGRRWRVIIPNAAVTEVADLTINSTTLVGREVTLGCAAFTWKDSASVEHTDTVIDFMESTETSSDDDDDDSND